MKIKVTGGTRQSGTNLCVTCHNGRIRYGDRQDQVYVSCSAMEDPKYPIRECSEYLNRDMPQLNEMKSIAWVLRTDTARQKIGFVRGDEWRRENKGLREIIPGEYD